MSPYMIPKEIQSQMEDMRIDLRADGPRQAMENVNRQLEAACREAFLQGKDFAIGPARYDVPDPFKPMSIFEPQQYSIEIPVGPVGRGWEPPQGWRVVQRPDCGGVNCQAPDEPAVTVHLDADPPYEETGECTGPTGHHEFAVGQIECVFCDNARVVHG